MYFKTISLLKRVLFGKYKYSMKVSIYSSFIKKEEEANKSKIIYCHVVP
jgi:hypothetical protein